MLVSVMKIGSKSVRVDVPNGTSVQGALEEAGYRVDGHTVAKNGTSCVLTAPVANGDTITLTPKVAGGLR